SLAAAGDWSMLGSGFSTQPGEPLFPRVDLDALRAEIGAGNQPQEEVTEVALEHKEPISIDEFARMELRVASVLKVEPHPKADRLLVFQLQLGNEQRQVVSGIRQHYQPEELEGKKVILVANLPTVK